MRITCKRVRVTLHMASSSKREEESALGVGGPVFDPPLYIQRYDEVIKIARKVEAKKVRFGKARV